MKENEKYYVTMEKGLSYIIGLIGYTLLLAYLLLFNIDYSDINVGYLIVAILVFILIIFTLLTYIQIKRKKLFIYYEGNTFYMSSLFGKTTTVDMSHGFKVKRTKGKIQYITVNNEKNIAEMLIGGNYKQYFEDIELLLTDKSKSTS